MAKNKKAKKAHKKKRSNTAADGVDEHVLDRLYLVIDSRKGTGLDAIDWARRMTDHGAGEILITSMDHDGTKSGFDLALTRAISDAVSVPVVASGGVGTLDHLVEGVTQGGASAVLAASIFHFGTFTIAQAKDHLARAGVPVRTISRAA